VENRPDPLLIERPVAGGEMLARHDGRIVFIRGVIPGERVTARIVRRAKGVAWAELVEIVEPSPDRRPVIGDAGCGGGYFAHIAPARQRVLKAEIITDAFRRIARHTLAAPPAVAMSPERGYRLRARLHVRDRRVGFFREQSHTLCDAAPSGQLHDAAISAAAALVAALGARADLLDAIVIAEDIPARQRVLHLEPHAGASLDEIAGAVSRVDGVTGITMASARRLIGIVGDPTVTDTAGALFGAEPPIAAATSWTRHATSFFQGNRFLTGALVRRVLDAVSDIGTSVVADLYAGVGLFAVALAAAGATVTAVEGDASSGADLTSNAKPFPMSVVHSTVEAALAGAAPPGLGAVVVDPPRTGMSRDAVAGLIGWRPARVVYVSCDPPTLARDARLLLDAGYRLSSVDAFDLFPNTPHVETVALFDR
jgi:23S rRNA (uracil1939-C5)-methyltransferase